MEVVEVMYVIPYIQKLGEGNMASTQKSLGGQTPI